MLVTELGQKPHEKWTMDSNDDNQFELKDYDSDDEDKVNKPSSTPGGQGLSSTSLEMMEQ